MIVVCRAPDTERATGSYSNRLSAHVLRRHRFHSPAAIRGWRNKLRLCVGDSAPPATRELPQWGPRAEYWIEGDGEECGADTTDSGNCLRLRTEQVRFSPIDAPQNSAHSYSGEYAMWLDPGQDPPAEVRYRFPGYVFDAAGSGRIWEDARKAWPLPSVRIRSSRPWPDDERAIVSVPLDVSVVHPWPSAAGPRGRRSKLSRARTGEGLAEAVGGTGSGAAAAATSAAAAFLRGVMGVSLVTPGPISHRSPTTSGRNQPESGRFRTPRLSRSFWAGRP